MRESKFVFIGKNLNHEELKAGFEACILTPELEARKTKDLRFKVGDVVECRTENGFEAGQITALMYRDEFMPTGVVAPYQVQLVSGDLIWAPEDDDAFIRAKQ